MSRTTSVNADNWVASIAGLGWAPPFAMLSWDKPTGAAADGQILSADSNTLDVNAFSLQLFGTSPTVPAAFTWAAGGGSAHAAGGTAISNAGIWQLTGAMFGAGYVGRTIIDQNGVITTDPSFEQPTVPLTNLHANGFGNRNISGEHADKMIFMRTLSVAEIGYMWAFGSPYLLGIDHYWKFNSTGTELDLVGTINFTVNGTTAGLTEPNIVNAYIGTAIPDQIWPVGVPIANIDLKTKFDNSVATLAPWTATLKQLGAAGTPTTTTASGAASNLVPAASVAGITAGMWISVGANAKVPVLFVQGSNLLIAAFQTWANGAVITPYPVQAVAAITSNGVAPNGSNVCTGTPTSGAVGSYSNLCFQSTNTAHSGAISYSNLFNASITSILAGTAAAAIAASGALTTKIQAAGSALLTVAAVSALTNWATVTLTNPLYLGPGGALDPNFWISVIPGAGSVLFYDNSKITIYPNDEISSTSNDCSAVVQFNDGIAESIGIIIITPGLVSYAHIISAAVGALNTGIQMAGAALVAAQTVADLKAAIKLAANALSVVSAAASMLTALQLNAAGAVNVSAAGSLTGGIASLQSNAQVLVQGIAGLTAKIQTAAQVIIDASALGSLSSQTMLQGAVNALTAAVGQLTTGVIFTGNASVTVTIAGVALLSTIFNGAANAVVSAMGSLLAAIQFAGTALITSSATGDLTAGIEFEGVALIDTAALFSPPGPEAQFGYAVITVFSPTGLPVDLATFTAGSACIISIAYFNALGQPFVPTAVSYRVDDLTSGANVVPLTPVFKPSFANAVTITASQNKMVSLTRSFEQHVILFDITDGVSNTSAESASFDLLRPVGG